MSGHVRAFLDLACVPAEADLPASIAQAVRFVAKRGGGSLRMLILPGAAFRFEADNLAPEAFDDADHGWQTTGPLGEDDLARLADTGDWPALQRRDVAFEPTALAVLEQADGVAHRDRLGLADGEPAGAAQFDPSRSAHVPSPSLDEGEDAAACRGCHVNESGAALREVGR